jgi:hypothetical protein
MLKVPVIGVAALLIGSIGSAGHAADRAGSKLGPVPLAFPSLTVIYHASGVRDSGGADNAGVATTIHCTNFSAATRQIRYVIRNFNGVIVANAVFNIGASTTQTKSTHGTGITEDLPHLSPGVSINQGAIAIFTTAAHVSCTAYVADAPTGASIGEIHLVRFNSWPGSQE